MTRSAARALHKSKYGLAATFHTFDRNDVLQLAAAAHVVDREYCKGDPRHKCQFFSRTLCLLLAHDRIYAISETVDSAYTWLSQLVVGVINGLVTVPQDKDGFGQDFVFNGQFCPSPFALRLVSDFRECVDQARSELHRKVRHALLQQLCVPSLP